MHSVDKALAPVPPAADCWYLTGPTAAGKTQVGVELALRLGAEIISLDSMALYQGMNIGTAKPPPVDQARVQHHLLDLIPPTEEFSLSEYIDAAHAAIADIKGRGREVLFVGGTPLYLKSLLRGVYQGPPADWEFRQQVDRELEALPLAALHERLQVIDPLLAAKLHPNDKRRIIRGLEVFKLTGQRLSHLQTQFDEAQSASSANVFVLSWPRDELHRRIDTRVEQMFATGLVEEVRGLLSRYGTLGRTAMQAVGYREVIEYVSPPLSLALSGRLHRPRQIPHPPIRPPPGNLVPLLERMHARADANRFRRRASGKHDPRPRRISLRPHPPSNH